MQLMERFYELQFEIYHFQGRHSGGSILQLSPGSYSTLTHSPNSNTTQVAGSTSFREFQKPYQSISSPGSVEVSSDLVIKNDRTNYLDIIESTGEVENSSDLEINQALRRLEEQLSLNDDSLEQIGSFYYETQNSNDGYIVHNQSSLRSAGMQDGSNNLMSQHSSGLCHLFGAQNCENMHLHVSSFYEDKYKCCYIQ